MSSDSLHIDSQDATRAIRNEADYARFLAAQWLKSITKIVSREWLEQHKQGYGVHFSSANLTQPSGFHSN
jgi:hypothetical protein